MKPSTRKLASTFNFDLLNRRRLSLLFFLYLLIFLFMSEPISVVASSKKPLSLGEPVFQKGMSYTGWWYNAYESADSDESLRRLSLTNTEYVCICVWWYQDTVTSTEIYAHSQKTPTNDSIVHAISRVHDLGMKVHLKPMIDPLDGHWRGEIPPSNEWFASYANFINFFAELAEEHGVEAFSVGCEFKQTVSWKSSWEAVIAGVRDRYSGPITYSANWDNYQNVHWWDSLDYVGIDAYFPLTDKNDPTLEELKAAWSVHADAIEAWQSTVNKPVIFTELGYRSVDGANKRPWEWGAAKPVDLQEQVDCYEATFQAFWNKSWFYGFYWWNWLTDPDAGGSGDDDFTPQNKPVEDTITQWYSFSERIHLSTLASLNKASYLLNEAVLLKLEFNTSYSTTLRVDYNVTKNGILVKSDGVDKYFPSSGAYEFALGSFETGDYSVEITILDLSADKVVYVASLEFAAGSRGTGAPIIPLIIFGIVLALVVLGLAVIMRRRKIISQ